MSNAVPHVLPQPDHRCEECGVWYAQVTIEDVSAICHSIAPDVLEAVTALRPEQRCVRGDDAWSVNEYVCHLRDVFITSTVRLHRARTEDRPYFDPMFNDLRARRFAYIDADAVAVTEELGRVARGFAGEVERLRPHEWDRVACRVVGEERTALFFVRHAHHEAVHHLEDIRRIVSHFLHES